MNVNSTLSNFSFGVNQTKAQGQVVTADQAPNATFNDEHVHTFGKEADGTVVELKFSDLLKAAEKGDSGKATIGAPETESVISADQKSLDEARNANLAAGKSVDVGRAIPKDASFHPTDYLMFSEAHTPLDLAYCERMSEVGQVEGFKVNVLTPSKDLDTVTPQLPLGNVTVTPTEAKADTWSEDYGERTFSGGLVIPAHLQEKSLVSTAILSDRISRFYGADQVPQNEDAKQLKADIKAKFPLADFDQLGAVSGGDFQELLIGAGDSNKWNTKEAAGSFEGGNVMTGTLANGQGYALIGRDTLAVSRAKISQDLGHAASDEETLKYLSSDLGIDSKNIHAIEQPGEFHLDMRIMAAAPGEVVLDDARQGYAIESAWARADHEKARPSDPSKLDAWKADGAKLDDQLAAMKKEDEKRALWEDKSAADLKASGLHVDRMAAVFTDLQQPSRDIANFANGRGGIDADGGRFLVGLGSSDPRMEQYAAKELLDVLPTGFDRIHFLDNKLTQDTLDQYGGIKCRTKPFGTEATLNELNHPVASELQAVA